MSDDSEMTPSEILSTWISQQYEVAASALFFYEYCITFSEEIKYLEGRSINGAILVFLVNRYSTLFNRMARLIQFVDWSGLSTESGDMACKITWRAIDIFTGLMYISVAVFSAMRLYAIWGKNRLVFVVILILGLVYPAVSMYYSTYLVVLSNEPGDAAASRGCYQYSTFDDQSTNAIFCEFIVKPFNAAITYSIYMLMFIDPVIFGVLFTMLFETTVLIFTWIKTLGSQRVLWADGIKISLYTVLIRDGTLYYGVILAFSASCLLSIWFSAFNSATTLTDTMISISLTRFMLHLRKSFVGDPALEGLSGSSLVSASRSGGDVGGALASANNEGSSVPTPVETRGSEMLWDAEEGLLHECGHTSPAQTGGLSVN